MIEVHVEPSAGLTIARDESGRYVLHPRAFHALLDLAEASMLAPDGPLQLLLNPDSIPQVNEFLAQCVKSCPPAKP